MRYSSKTTWGSKNGQTVSTLRKFRLNLELYLAHTNEHNSTQKQSSYNFHVKVRLMVILTFIQEIEVIRSMLART